MTMSTQRSLKALVALLVTASGHAFVPSLTSKESSTTALKVHDAEPFSLESDSYLDRRQAMKQGLGIVFGAAAFTGATSPTSAYTGASDGNLPDLPAEAVRSYVQYRAPLQTSLDYYLFDLLDTLDDTSNWCVRICDWNAEFSPVACSSRTHFSTLCLLVPQG